MTVVGPRMHILSFVTKRDTRNFPASTAVPVLTFFSLLRIKVPDIAGHNDAEDITAKHANFKTIFHSKTKTPQLFLHHCGYSLSSNLMSS